MAITQDGGHMNHNTVEDVAQPSVATTSTGPSGMLARSDVARLAAAFPASPMIGDSVDYDTATVANLKGKILTNTVKPDDIGESQAHWAFASPEASEEIPSSPDLTFNGAPDVEAATTDKEGNAIASSYIPNLVPPDSFSPIMDNQDATATENFVESKTSLPPYVGDGLANPSVTSKALHEHLVPAEGDGDSGIAPFTGVGSGGTGTDGS